MSAKTRDLGGASILATLRELEQAANPERVLDRVRICLGHKKINFSTGFDGQAVGIKEVHDDIWLISFMNYDLGYFDLNTRVLAPLENPFGPELLPMWPVRSVTHLSGLDQSRMVGLGGLEPPTSPLSGARSSHLSYRPEKVNG
jgi:hypothetical protein